MQKKKKKKVNHNAEGVRVCLSIGECASRTGAVNFQSTNLLRGFLTLMISVSGTWSPTVPAQLTMVLVMTVVRTRRHCSRFHRWCSCSREALRCAIVKRAGEENYEKKSFRASPHSCVYGAEPRRTAEWERTRVSHLAPPTLLQPPLQPSLQPSARG